MHRFSRISWGETFCKILRLGRFAAHVPDHFEKARHRSPFLQPPLLRCSSVPSPPHLFVAEQFSDHPGTNRQTQRHSGQPLRCLPLGPCLSESKAVRSMTVEPRNIGRPLAGRWGTRGTLRGHMKWMCNFPHGAHRVQCSWQSVWVDVLIASTSQCGSGADAVAVCRSQRDGTDSGFSAP